MTVADNYAYLVIDEATKKAACIDPAEPKVVLEAAKKENVELTHILTTHAHWDHAGGNEEMKRLVPNLEVVGGKGDRAQAVMREVGDGDTVLVGSLEVKVLYTPCHTAGHVCYYLEPKDGRCCVFTGDTMFVAGCGNFNAGTPQQMFHALVEKIGSLPPDTLVYVSDRCPGTCELMGSMQCGHEYTEKNLMYAQTAEPNNQAIKDKLAWVRQQRAQGNPTVPSTVSTEWQINPFLRCR